MNKLLLAGAVVAGLATGPALAADSFAPLVLGPQAFVGAGAAFGNTNLPFGPPGGFNINNSVVAVGGTVNVPLAGGLNIEIEGQSAMVTLGFGGGSFSGGYSKGQIHAYLRNPGFAIGAYGGYEAPIIGLSLWNIGAEAQAYWQNMTLTGQLAFVNWNTGGGPSGTATSARGGVKFFLTDNIAFDGDIRWMSTSVAGGANFTLAAGAEARVAGTPWALFGNVRWSNVTFNTGGPSGSIGTTSGLVGVRAHVGNGSLFQGYRTGYSFNTLPLI